MKGSSELNIATESILSFLVIEKKNLSGYSTPDIYNIWENKTSFELSEKNNVIRLLHLIEKLMKSDILSSFTSIPKLN